MLVRARLPCAAPPLNTIFAGVLHGEVQSIVTLLRPWVISWVEMNLSLPSPIVCSVRRPRGVGEGDLVVGQSEVRRTLGGGLHSLRWLDRFLDGSLGGDGAVMLGVEDLPNFSLKC